MSGINDVRFSKGEPKNREQARNIGADCKADSTDHPTPSAPGARVKLTTVRRLVLSDYARLAPGDWATPWELGAPVRTAKWLHRAGLLARRQSLSSLYRITEAGRAALSQEEDHE